MYVLYYCILLQQYRPKSPHILCVVLDCVVSYVFALCSNVPFYFSCVVIYCDSMLSSGLYEALDVFKLKLQEQTPGLSSDTAAVFMIMCLTGLKF